MSAIPSQSPVSTCFSSPTDQSAKPKRRKHLAKNQCVNKDSRVYIGSAFRSWRALRNAKGFRSDTDLAQHLLDETKTLHPMLDPAGASDMKLKISQSEVQALIQQEVNKAVENKEKQIEDIIRHIQNTNDENGFETAIQKLENRIDAVARRAEVALSYLKCTQKQSSLSSTDVHRDGQENDPMEAVSQDPKRTNCEAKRGELLKMMEKTKIALKRYCAEKKVLKTAMADLDPEESPPVLTPWGSPPCKEMKKGMRNLGSCKEDLYEKKSLPRLTLFDSPESMVGLDSVTKLPSRVKTEKTDFHKKNYDNEEHKQFDEPIVKRLRTDDSSPGHSRSPAPKEVEGTEPMKDGEEMLFYPPLPCNPFPSVLKMEAASYSVPQRVDVKLAFIRNPNRISVLWNVEDEDPSAPPMESYTIFLAMESYKGSGKFPHWEVHDKLEAKALPMCALINNSKRGHRLCAAVVGKDIFGRYGPYSKVATAILPD